MKKVKAVMMAGGFGTRIQPLTHSLPKPMLPVMNVPMMENILKKLKRSGIEEVVILLYYMPEVIKNHFKDGKKWGVKINYVLPDADYGTAGAVGFAREFLDTTFIIVSGDLVSDFDFKKIIEHHSLKNSKLTITLTSVENPLEFGIVITDEEGRIQKFLEKPSWGEVFSNTINTGIYIIEPEILSFIPKNEPFDFSKDLFPLLMEKNIELFGYVAKGYWRDVGNPESYREVHQDIFNGKVRFDFPYEKTVFKDAEVYSFDGKIPKNIHAEGKIVIGKNVKMGKNVRLYNCVIGDNVVIGDECKIKNTVIWNDVQIGKKSVFDYCVLCNDVKIGDMVEAKAGAVIAEGCVIGDFANIAQDVTVWPNKEIEPAAIVTNNIVFGTKYKNALFNDGVITGTANIEIGCDMACKIGEAFGSHLPKGSVIAVGRDFEAAARMLKRAFVGGVLAGGVNIVDLKSVLPSVLRLYILENENIKGGAYFRKSLYDPSKVEIVLFNEEGLRLKRDVTKKIEKNFFKESFRKVEYEEIGVLEDDKKYYKDARNMYISKIRKLIDDSLIKGESFKVAIDLMWGITKSVYPDILKFVEIENILLNSYYDNIKVSNISHFEKESKKYLSTIVRCVKMNVGFLIYPQGQRLSIIGDDGNVLDRIGALNLVLYLYNEEAKRVGKKFRVFLPVWAPDLFDGKFEHLKIERGKYSDFKISSFKGFDLIATVDGNFAFTEFSYHRDAIYASLKIMEMLIRYNLKISEIEKDITPFYYKIRHIPCLQSQKGEVMRKFIEYAKNKKHTLEEGIKIYENENEWVLMLPDSYEEKLNLYIQAENELKGMALYEKYAFLIKGWIK
ncbi:sugar phosphate nucleotidyltransferase [Nautilia sp.]